MNVLLAPNGKPSKLTPEQYKLVRTPEFKSWFGDWEKDPANASKVVDENGEPLVVYRGVHEKQRNLTGFWLTISKSYAENYGEVNEYFVNIRKPMTEELFDKTWMVDYEKYDGRLGNFNKIVVKTINQIKLADGTNITFDGNNPDIRFAKGGKVIVLPADSQKYQKIGVEDKYFIEASKDVGLQGINFDVQSISKKITDEYTKLINDYETYLINEDSPSITSYIKNEIETKKELGASLDEINNLEQSIENQNARNKIIYDIAQTQKATVVQWIDYLKQSNYPVDFKYLILKAILTFNYDLKQNKLYERGNDTIRNFTPFDAGSLAELFTNQSEFLLRDYSVLMNENSAKV